MRRILLPPLLALAIPTSLWGQASERAPGPPAASGVPAASSALGVGGASPPSQERLRVRELGVNVGIFDPGPWNAITDVPGVRVGQVTLRDGVRVNTGITAILPHEGDLFRERVPAAIHVGNGFGKLLGITQVRELGELETPIILTCTLCVWQAADAMVEWLLERPGMEGVRSINPVVGETNDGSLNDIRARPIDAEHVRGALEGASSGPVEEGSVGAGTGTRAFGWKGGIGTSSRALPESLGGWTVGALVQSNFGGILSIAGAPVGQELGRYSYSQAVGGTESEEEGSIMIVVATDAPLSDRNLERLARRATMGLARTGSSMSNGSGDYVIAFSTASQVRRAVGEDRLNSSELVNSQTSALFQAVVESTEEAIYNSLFMATTVEGMGSTAEALPLEEVIEILERFNVRSSR